ncbi:hypothetical protein BDC45DRAFT_536779 [Circinella umbellata]|nr:hypothetical protein BDC45DRAFT_536779 [Circinella umbellata]
MVQRAPEQPAATDQDESNVSTIETEERVISPPVEEVMLLSQLMENSNKENVDNTISTVGHSNLVLPCIITLKYLLLNTNGRFDLHKNEYNRHPYNLIFRKFILISIYTNKLIYNVLIYNKIIHNANTPIHSSKFIHSNIFLNHTLRNNKFLLLFSNKLFDQLVLVIRN